MSKGVRRAALALLLVSSLTACGGSASPKVTTTLPAGIAPTPPAGSGAYFGAWVDPHTQSLTGFEKSMGRTLDIVSAYRTFGQSFPSGSADRTLLAGKSTVLLTLTGGDTKQIGTGKADKEIKARAAEIAKTRVPIYLRWQPDMDTTANAGTVHSAADYIAAWKRMRKLFAAAGADNVAWVWCPSAAGFGDSGKAADYYPGDGQVDWVCADAFPTTDDANDSLGEVLSPFLSWAGDHGKPIMIGEFGVPKAYGARRADWLRGAATTLQNPQVKAVVYFDSDSRSSGYSVTGDAAALSALRELATSPFFNPRDLLVASS